MGCDIHIYTEKLIDGEWIDADYFQYEKDRFFNKFVLERVPIYINRNYRLFARLANVRNYERNEYICEPRGIPHDVSFEIGRNYASAFEYHNASYLTFRELNDFAKKMTPLKMEGYIKQEEVEYVLNGGTPSFICRDYSPKDGRFVWVEWTQGDEYFIEFVKLIENRIKEIWWDAEYKGVAPYMDRFRIIFWFDN